MRKDTTEQQRRSLLEEARTFATEAMHLYSNIQLPHRANRCKHLVKEIEKISGKPSKPVYLKKIYFNPKWLHLDFLVARSQEMKKTLSKVQPVARTDISVLINGETGTGKEILAKYIHTISDRKKGPFVVINCASIADSVFESELFGHHKGAFTGADSSRIGLIEQAEGGTLFLDEISELSPQHQAKLLRFIEKKKIRRVGESEERNTDIRILSAVNEEIEGLLESKRLRKDLYYRIAGRTIALQPLRNRREDIEALFSYYINRFGGDGFYMADGVIKLLCDYHWPGNIRELVNLTKHLTSLREEDKVIYPHDMPVDIINPSSEFHGTETKLAAEKEKLRTMINNKSHLHNKTEELRRILLLVLENNSWNKSAVARELGITRKTLYRYLDKLNLTET